MEEPAPSVSPLTVQLAQLNQLNQLAQMAHMTQMGLLNPVMDVQGAGQQWSGVPCGYNLFYWC